jgi:hypothetical protein
MAVRKLLPYGRLAINVLAYTNRGLRRNRDYPLPLMATTPTLVLIPIIIPGERDGPRKHSGLPARADTGRGDDRRPASRIDDGTPLPWPLVPLLRTL